ncbi:hypothetical protein K438DRAFT_2144540 [Mycena galopus ATCC 62051]|nr:hypothetical protein K438DRAFT_2144540 [Mycena galopus ATCC 62051]
MRSKGIALYEGMWRMKDEIRYSQRAGAEPGRQEFDAALLIIVFVELDRERAMRDLLSHVSSRAGFPERYSPLRQIWVKRVGDQAYWKEVDEISVLFLGSQREKRSLKIRNLGVEICDEARSAARWGAWEVQRIVFRVRDCNNTTRARCMGEQAVKARPATLRGDGQVLLIAVPRHSRFDMKDASSSIGAGSRMILRLKTPESRSEYQCKVSEVNCPDLDDEARHRPLDDGNVRGRKVEIQGHRPPKGWGIQSDFSPLAANLGQKGGRVKTCKWWIVGVGWQEVDEDLGGDLVGECQYWVLNESSALGNCFSVRNAKKDRSRSKILGQDLRREHDLPQVMHGWVHTESELLWPLSTRRTIRSC